MKATQRLHNLGQCLRLHNNTRYLLNTQASNLLYIVALAAPFTANTMPEATLNALADHGEIGAIMAADGGDCEAVLGQFAALGINVDYLAAQLQGAGAKSVVKSWNELLTVIGAKSTSLKAESCSMEIAIPNILERRLVG
jgi:transaldolase